MSKALTILGAVLGLSACTNTLIDYVKYENDMELYMLINESFDNVVNFNDTYNNKKVVIRGVTTPIIEKNYVMFTTLKPVRYNERVAGVVYVYGKMKNKEEIKLLSTNNRYVMECKVEDASQFIRKAKIVSGVYNVHITDFALKDCYILPEAVTSFAKDPVRLEYANKLKTGTYKDWLNR